MRKLATARFLALSAALVCASVMCTAQALAEDLTPKQKDLFEIHIRPTLTARCIRCHGETKQEGGLRLTSLDGLLAGGDSGPAIVPGKPDESLLLEALRYESFEMPPDGKLDAKLVDGVAAWIASGAPWPRQAILRPAPKITEQDREWWSFQPIADPAVPEVADQGWSHSEIDHFVYARLAAERIKPSPAASPRTLVRRLYYAVTGLPPGEEVLEQVEQLSAAEFEAYFDQKLDELLESPAYGENQARFWLDLVRYADSDGYNADHGRPDARQYRDYVIRSYNDDKPYDRFVTEQLAGDEVDPGNRDALIATMYLRHWIYEWNQRDVEGQWQEILNDVTETTADTFLALGLKCARCHDHKFDPLLQKDYFRLQAFFAALQPREDQPVADLETRTQYYEQYQAWAAATNDIRQRLHEIEHPVLLKHATREGFDKFVPEIRNMISKRVVARQPYEHQIASLASRQFDLDPDKLSEWLDKETEAERQELRQRLAEFESMKPKPLPTLKFVASDVGPVAPPTYIIDDPNHTQVAPGYPTILDEDAAAIVPPPPALESTGRRTALARWLTDPQNPLTARVLVNRVWQQHFGRGLAETVSDFGKLGTPPTHPELLDWLATRFMEDGWSLKKLHRRILTSATWRQVSDRPADDRLRKLDPTNRLLWRMNSRRLAAEEIVDTFLSMSGELGSQKRAVYRSVLRNKPDAQLGFFDFPDRIRSQGQRHQTTTSTQALMLLNNSWAHDRASSMARSRQNLGTPEFIDSAYRRLFLRPPTEEELGLAEQFLGSYAAVTPSEDEQEQPELAKMPGGQPALDFDPKQPGVAQVPWSEELPNGDFTIEARVLLRSLYPDATVRTIASQWSGNKASLGWSLGVTSTRSAYKPKNLILQLVGKTAEGKMFYEVIASNLRVELNKPYYVAVSVDLDDTSPAGINFYLKDLSDKNAKLQTAQVAHQVTSEIRPKQAIEIGGRVTNHLWDGLIQNVRLYGTALSGDVLSNEERSAEASQQLIFDAHFSDPQRLGFDASGHNRHAQLTRQADDSASPQTRARVALLHALLNSNELIYVD